MVWLLRKLLGDSVEDDKSEISNKVEAQKEAEKNVARKAWRATMLGAVGSLAFFLDDLRQAHRKFGYESSWWDRMKSLKFWKLGE